MKVSLFPFLPVLLCMMGAMILFLVLVAWNIQESATQSNADAVSLEEAEELQYKIQASLEDADWHIENFTLARQQAEEKLAEEQHKLALAEKETQRIKEELVRLQTLIQELNSETSATPDEVEHLKNLLERQTQALANAEWELDALRKEFAGQEKSYSIVPSRSPNGTFRRPIYIECRDNRIIIQPEGIELFPGDFVALNEPTNPFDTVLRVIRQYYMETEQISRGSEPYPLFLVRPSGVEMYDKALFATGNWVNAFGYELINEDWNLQYPTPNDELRRRASQQLELARNRLSGAMLAQRIQAVEGRWQAEPRPEGRGEMGDGKLPTVADTSAMTGEMQQYRMDHRGNVVPVGGEWQQMLEARRQQAREAADERQQATADAIAKTATDYQSRNGEVVEGVEESRQPPQRSQNWALKDATPFSMAISRSVRIRCEADRFVLVAQPGLPTDRVILIEGNAYLATDKLVQAIWEFQESWGSAGENKHWRPRLQVRVAPGAETRLQELKIYLNNSGLVIED